MISSIGSTYLWKVADTGEELVLNIKPITGRESKLHEINIQDLDITLGLYFMGEVSDRECKRVSATDTRATP